VPTAQPASCLLHCCSGLCLPSTTTVHLLMAYSAKKVAYPRRRRAVSIRCFFVSKLLSQNATMLSGTPWAGGELMYGPARFWLLSWRAVVLIACCLRVAY